MPEFDLLIKDGMIIDGTRAPRFRDDIAIKDGKIAKIGRTQAHEAAKVIEADGLIVAPGFIDLHTHYDAKLSSGRNRLSRRPGFTSPSTGARQVSSACLYRQVSSPSPMT